MSFIPNELQELKRQAEAALGIVMIQHPEQSRIINQYWGELELALHKATETIKQNWENSQPG